MKNTIFFVLLASSLMADAKIDAMQEQLDEVESKLNSLQAQNTNTTASFSQNAYLPDIALVLNMSALSRDVSNSEYESYAIPGFIDSGDAILPFNKDRGFNLNYAEVAMHSVVDPYFEAFAIFHLSPAEFEIEEAYVQTTSFPYFLRLKAGKFRSDFGRINAKHHHTWNFDSQPIIYEALFGVENLSDAGLQVQWVAPTDTYLMLGLEAMQGTNQQSFGYVEANNLYNGYIKSSVDIGDELSILGGLSVAHGENTSNNPTDIYGVDLTLRRQLGSYSALIWQSEYLRRVKELTSQTDTQGGLYSELIYKYDKNYSIGMRYDLISKNDTNLTAYNGIDTTHLDRYTATIDYYPFPMSRLRLSYTYDATKVINAKRENINEVMLSLNIAAGAHAAHNY